MTDTLSRTGASPDGGPTPTRGGRRVKVATGPRKDIQGLRAVAVLLVVAEHLTGWPHGGFIGVDVFFVISGFLITGLLLREHERTGRISFTSFYRRRARRILPAATLVLVVTAVGAWLVYPETRARTVGVDAIWAFFFAGNYRFASADTDYFAATADASPLQHFWSLAVEEQFYFVWPWLMLLALTLLARAGRGHHSRLLAGGMMTVIVVGSFAWGLHETLDRPAWAYFSTLARVWELGLGALLAIATPLLAGVIGRRTGAVVSWSGLGLIVAGAFLVSAEQGFPVPWAALPVVGSALVIAGGVGGTPPYLAPLTNKAMTYVGDLSYSLYLWHFPVIVLLAAALPSDSALYLVTALVVMSILTVTSYHCFENPIHHSSWLEPRSRRKAPEARRSARAARVPGSPGLRVPGGRHVVLGVVGVLAAVGTVGVAIAVAPQTQVRGEAELRAIVAAPDDGTATGAWRKDVARALLATEWPTLTPSVDELGRDDIVDPWSEDGCLAFEDGADPDPIVNARRCVYGDPDADRTLAVLGDSIGISWVPAIEEAFGETWRIEVWTARQCTVADVEVTETDGGAYPECSDFRRDARAALAAENPDVLVVTSEGDPRQVAGTEGTDDAFARLGEGLATAAEELAPIAEHTVYLPPPPPGLPLTECRTGTAVPADCVRRPAGLPGPWYDAFRAAAEDNGAAFVDVVPWFCVGGVGCPGFVDGVPVRADAAHLTDPMSRKVAPLVREGFAAALPEVFAG
ncbi:acyltransferase [Nocardioides sp. ChNu-153]|uniref:acyltransferase family protein n=1 Tax=unclassified Nocardioides TaxID=2615069 RepID=UPI002404FF20|nr:MULTISPECIES: acyltransferase family protein [unclassified Nocardioides]MDF9714997.1 acyltransferase [Nocardioides sp. ChNu-99]MDN7122266.1 acyltransferase [Nocardioides sp. ChNu-153]